MRLHVLSSLLAAATLAATLASCGTSNPASVDRLPTDGQIDQTLPLAPSPDPASGLTPDFTVGSGPLPTGTLALPVNTNQPGPDDFAAGRILVSFQPGTDATTRAALHARLGGTLESTIAPLDVEVIAVPTGQELTRVALYAAEPTVAYAEPDHAYGLCVTPNDTYFNTKQWDMKKISLPAAWDVTTGSTSVKVAVLDTGMDLLNGDVAPQMVGSKNFTGTGSSVQDGHGHGTHCAGTVAAVTNNAKGVAGVGWNTKLLVGKVLSNSGSGYSSWISSGVTWSADNGAKVISMSLGGGGYSSTFNNAINYAFNKGVVVVAAAGNSNSSNVSYPAGYANCIAVGSTTSSDARSSFSNWGSWVTCAAPGSSIFSTYKNSTATTPKYATMSGTSMACPHVAGLAALVWATPFGTSAAAVRSRVESTGDAITTDKPIGKRINAARAVGAVE